MHRTEGTAVGTQESQVDTDGHCKVAAEAYKAPEADNCEEIHKTVEPDSVAAAEVPNFDSEGAGLV